MDTITIKVDAGPAGEYIAQYREFSSDHRTDPLDDKSLLQAFVPDRRREEIEFIANENE